MNKNQKLTAELFEEYYEIYEMLYHCAKVADSGAYALNNAFGYFSESQVLDLFNKSKQDLKNIIVANTNTRLRQIDFDLANVEKGYAVLVNKKHSDKKQQTKGKSKGKTKSKTSKSTKRKGRRK